MGSGTRIAGCCPRLDWMNCGDDARVVMALLLWFVAVVGCSCASTVETDYDSGFGSEQARSAEGGASENERVRMSVRDQWPVA